METTIVPTSYWLSQGYSQLYAESIDGLQLSIIEGTIKLKLKVQDHHEQSNHVLIVEGSSQTSQPADKEHIIDLFIGQYSIVSDLPDGLLLHNDALLPLWEEFASAIRELSNCGRGYKVHLIISKIELPVCVLNILVPVLQNISIGRLTLHTRLDHEGYGLLCNLLQSNQSISLVCLSQMNIDGRDISILSQAASVSSSLKTFILRKCSLSDDDHLSFFPLISNTLRQVTLSRLGIGCQGAMMISHCLATNPQVEILDLEQNLLGDIDAEAIANSLKSNTHLARLYLRRNCFTGDGIKALIRVVYDEESLNAMYDANASCELILFNENEIIPNGIDETVLGMNKKIPLSQYFPLIPDSMKLRCSKLVPSGDVMAVVKLMYMEGSKRLKILHALRGGKERKFNMQHLNGVSFELFPQVLSFLQDCHKLQPETNKESYSLDTVYQILRSTPQAVVPFDVCQGYKYYLELSVIPLSVVFAISIVFFIIWGCWLLLNK